MRTRSSGFYSSSLEMLLDTMCNMLGGVVFIALMVSLVARDSVTHTTPVPPSPSAHELAALTASNQVAQINLQSISNQLQDVHRAQTNFLHLPHLENTRKLPWLVIAQYGKLYPLDVLSTNGTPHAIINRTKVIYQPGSKFLETRPGKGDDAETSVTQMAGTFHAVQATNYYLAFLVYDDSFDTFVKARETAARLGLQYGWNPLPHGQRLQIGAQGERILPQD